MPPREEPTSESEIQPAQRNRPEKIEEGDEECVVDELSTASWSK
jgi:hypothetical protein